MNSPFHRINRLPPYVFNVIGELKAQARNRGEDIIDFSMGNPDVIAPPHVIDKLVETAVKPAVHRYSASKGIPRLRSAMADWYQERYGVELDVDKEVIVTIGSKEGLAHLALATLGPGDTVLVPNPAYPIHPYGVVIAGADVRHVPLTDENDFLRELEDAIVQSWPKPKMLILNFPANPTGQCVDLSFFEAVIAIAKEHKVWVINDLAYAELVYDGYQAPSILQVNGAKDHAVEFYSLSKSYNMAGWRVGFCCGNETLVAALTRIKSYLDYGIFTPIQVAAIAALKGPQDCVDEIRARYQQRRDVLCEGLNAIGWPCTPPKATMFVWAKIPEAFRKMGSLEFSKLLIEEAKVAVSPGIGFGQYGDDSVRFALIENEQRTKQALKNMKKLFKMTKTIRKPVQTIRYKSTRSNEPATFNFKQVVLSGLARDGGLFVPDIIPNVRNKMASWQGLSYPELAVEIIQLFVGDCISREDLKDLVDKSYQSFSHPDICPLVHKKQVSVLELFHGPTYAFKDFALQFLGNVFEYFLSKTDKLNILGATSGDTGSAAIYGVKGKENINIFMLHPANKVSPVQERQMTTVLTPNVYNIAVDGTFDDCQSLVKQVFSDLEFRDEYHLGAVNSINWARILAQIVYYFYATFRFREDYPNEPVFFSVPTGNFGDVYAGYLARQMGLPIAKLVIGTNENNILERTFSTGLYQVDQVQQTVSPAMDIQLASNFERFLYYLCDEQGEKVREKMEELKEKGEYQLSEAQLRKMHRYFHVFSVNKDQTYQTMAELNEESYVADPHTAVGIAAARRYTDKRVICLATAHPAKFPDSVQAAIGIEPEKTSGIAALDGKPSRCLSAEASMDAIKAIILKSVEQAEEKTEFID